MLLHVWCVYLSGIIDSICFAIQRSLTIGKVEVNFLPSNDRTFCEETPIDLNFNLGLGREVKRGFKDIKLLQAWIMCLS